MNHRLLVRLPYSIKDPAHLFSREIKPTQKINVSPFVRFNLKGNHFQLKADGPAQISESHITLHFSVNAAIEIQPATPEFGNIRLPNSQGQLISVQNIGNVPLSITRVVFENKAFSLAAVSVLPVSLEPGAKQSMQIHFRPVKLGPHHGTLTFWSNELKHSTANLIGYGAESQVVITDALIQRVLTFFNNINTPQEIINRIQDDPSFLRAGGATYGINFQQASAILSHRNRLPGKRFASLEQLDAVFGIGPDTLHDIFYSFSGND